MKRFLKNSLSLFCSANLILISNPGQAEPAQVEQNTEQTEASKEQAFKSAEQIGSRILVTMADGTQKTLRDLLTSSERVEDMIFHIPEYNLHLRMKAKPAKDSVLLIFQMLDANGNPTDRMAQVKIDPSTDKATLFGHLQDCMHVLTANMATSKNMGPKATRLPAAACRESQTTGEQLRNILVDVSLIGSGVLLAALSRGREFALLKLPLLVLGGGLAYYGVYLVHGDLLPPCPRN